MRRPARDPCHNKDRREKRRGDPAEVIGNCAIEIQVGKQLFLPLHYRINPPGSILTFRLLRSGSDDPARDAPERLYDCPCQESLDNHHWRSDEHDREQVGS